MSASAPESPLCLERGQAHQPELIWRDELLKDTKAKKSNKTVRLMKCLLNM